MSQEDEKGKAVGVATTAAAIGAGAGIGVAALFAIPLLVPALIGAGVACIGGAVIASNKK